MYVGEKFNSIIYFVGIVFVFLGFGVLILVSVDIGWLKVIVGFCVFGFFLVFVYMMLMFYYSFKLLKMKQFFKFFDYILIYLLIVGIYMLIMLISMSECGGWKLFFVVWVLVFFGVFIEVFFLGKVVKVLQLLIYFVMGWFCVIDFVSVWVLLLGVGFVWLFVGGVMYMIGVCFYLFDKVK